MAISTPRTHAAGLAYAEQGAGPPVLLVHGAMTALDDMLLALGDTLAACHRVIAVDRPGHGASPRARGVEATPMAQAARLHALAQALELERPVVVGHSFGGAVALAYALQYPTETAGVVALAPIVFPELRLEAVLFGPRAVPGAGDLLAAGAHATADRAVLPLLWRAMFLPQAMPAAFAARFPFALEGRAAATRWNGEDALAIGALALQAWRYPALRPPLHVLFGDADVVINNWLHGAVLARMVPNARLTRLPGLGHMLHHFAPGAVADAVADVLARP